MFLKTKTRDTMKNSYRNMPDGYRESIRKGMQASQFYGKYMHYGSGTKEERIARLKDAIETAEAIVIGAGAGISTSAGFTYSGDRFDKWFGDFADKYGFRDMYSGGFCHFRTKEEFWAYWARYIYINRYLDAPKPVYDELFSLVKDMDYFVITTNVDHQFQKAGFDKARLFYTQGDYGLFQSTSWKNKKTYDNEEWVMKAMEAQGFVKDDNGEFVVPEGGAAMEIPTELIPNCPDDGFDMTMNLRSDESFVEDEGWHAASAAYSRFLSEYEGRKVLFMELGVGANTPVIIKFPFWEMTRENPRSTYACINYGEAFCPGVIKERSILIDSDIGEVLEAIRG